jgi:hypothetical protein
VSDVAARIEAAAKDLARSRGVVLIRLDHPYPRAGLDPVLTLLHALVRWSADVRWYTGRALAETEDGRACDPVANDARAWSVFGALERVSFDLRLYQATYEWPAVLDDFARDAATLLASGDSAQRPAGAILAIDQRARALTFDERREWIVATFEARRRAVEDAIDERARKTAR